MNNYCVYKFSSRSTSVHVRVLTDSRRSSILPRIRLCRIKYLSWFVQMMKYVLNNLATFMNYCNSTVQVQYCTCIVLCNPNFSEWSCSLFPAPLSLPLFSAPYSTLSHSYKPVHTLPDFVCTNTVVPCTCMYVLVLVS